MNRTSTVDADPLVGRVVDGRYAVASRIARGGMATVYLATDNRLDRDVALKVMHPHLADDEEFVARFHREAKSAARMSHPAVVQVYDQGEDAGTVYLTMELVTGATLRDLLAERGALTVREALDVLEPVADALASAHRAGIVHRDVKPENVLLTDDGRVKVADFGLARAASTSQSGTTGMLIGTVAYLSPELVLRGVADARSDVYAAGILLFEMLTGRQPFTGDVPIQVAYQHVNSEVPAPSTLDPGIPAALDDIVLWATARDPDERPADARELFAELRELRGALSAEELDREPELAAEPDPDAATGDPDDETAPGRTLALRRPEPVTEPTQEQDWGYGPGGRRRRRGLIALVAVLVVAAAMGVAAWFFMAGPGAYTTTPQLAGQQVEDAQRALAAEGLQADQLPRYDEEVPAGHVIDTRPGAGEPVRKGGTVQLFVSQGSAFVSVPEVAGQPLDAAKQTLTDADLSVGEVTQEFSETVEKGTVVSQAVKPGEELQRGEPVGLVVSKGRQPIDVPSVVGKERKAAVAAVEGANLEASVSERFSDTVKAGVVVSQTPAEGTLYRGDTVELVVSKGPPLVEVPGVRGKQLAEATRILKDAGLDVKVHRLVRGGFDTVLGSDPPAGRKVPRGSVVTLQVV